MKILLKKLSLALFAVCLLGASVVNAQDFSQLVDILRGAKIIAQDDKNTYLGKLANAYDSDSIFNEYGTYGSEYSSKSIWNEYSTFGSEYSSYSPFNSYTSTPPMIIKNGKVIGYLTTNKAIKASVSPNILKAIKEEF